MQLVMLRYESGSPEKDQVFLEFAKASCRAQELESLLKLNLQYSLALAGEFRDVDQSDVSALKHDVISMGQIYEKLKPYLLDESLSSSIQQALVRRNALVHHFFLKHQSGLVLRAEEINDALKWCRRASAEFGRVCSQLELRWAELAARFDKDPDAAVPGMKARVEAIERGEWP